MQIIINGHHLDITDSIREAVNGKLKKLQQHFPDIALLNVILTVEKHQQIAEVTTHFLGQDFTAKASAEDLYQAIGDMANKLGQLLKRQKDKVKSHSHDKPQAQTETIES
jgi:putative sigma-54 modulation protein